eukprot:m.75538 g.75538  ORF g.75538 m.75538 type:complete len:284 (-) comp24797_c0_seq1:177-1028(-)
MDDEEEDDYLSDKFLSVDSSANVPTKVDPRWEHPSWKRKAKQLEDEKANVNKRPRSKAALVALENESRERGLATKIDTKNNKGFALMARMGYKAGSGLGKTGDGITTPVPVNVRQGRGGLGLQHIILKRNEAQSIAKVKLQTRKKRDTTLLQLGFRERKLREYKEKQAAHDLPAAQLACETLDKQQGLESNELWYKPPKTEEQLEADEEKRRNDADGTTKTDEDVQANFNNGFDTLEPTEQLAIVAQYLKQAHLYCTWCGRQYCDREEMENECAGDTRADHDD